MKKILFITSSLARNGTEAFIMNVFRNIDRTKYMFDFLLSERTANGYYEEAASLGSKIYYHIARRNGYITYRKSLDDFFKMHSKEYDAVHWCGCSLTSIRPLFYAKKYGIPIRIVHSHNSQTKGLHNRLFHFINKIKISNLATNYLACSQVAADYFYKGTKCYNQAIIIKNGINVDAFKFDNIKRESLRENMGLTNKFVVGHIGRFCKVKNHNFLIDIFSEICKNRKNAELILIGEGEDVEIIKQKVYDLGIQDKTRFMGVCNNVNDILQVMDCFLFPSLWEGLPFVLIEAQTAGLSVFTSTNVSKEVELTDNIQFLSLEKSPVFWANSILEAKVNRQDVSSQIIEKGFSIKNTINQLIEIYENSN